MKKYKGLIRRARELEYKNGINYAKTDGKLFKALKILSTIAFVYNFGINLMFVWGMFLKVDAMKQMGNLSVDFTETYTAIIFVGATTLISLVGLILLYCKFIKIGGILNSLPLLLTLPMFGHYLVDDMSLLQGILRTLFGYKFTYYYRHFIPVVLIFLFVVCMVIIDIRARHKFNTTYKKVMNDLYAVYKENYSEESDISGVAWEKFMESYDPDDYKAENLKAAKKRQSAMSSSRNFAKIAVIRTDFPEKFGIPRQSGIVKNLKGRIVFEPEYRDVSAIKGLDEFSHLWLLWEFSENVGAKWSPTVRPPRLGGNKRMGVFATRSPFRPNPIGLSCVKIEGIRQTVNEGTVIDVSGVDMLDGTPVYDIKPYIPYTDSHPEAKGGFSDKVYSDTLSVEIPCELEKEIPHDILQSIKEILSGDPRPGYKTDSDRVYGLDFSVYRIKFTVNDGKLTVVSIEKTKD